MEWVNQERERFIIMIVMVVSWIYMIAKTYQVVKFKYQQFAACHLYLTKTLKVWFKIRISIFYNSGPSVWQTYIDSTISSFMP